MEFLKLKFWLNLALVMMTFYIIVWYIFKPSNNQCQMTFMMEPPKFLPVPVGSITNDEPLSLPDVTTSGSQQGDSRYKLYIYSEYGFPQASDVRRDLKDSMPVLFVPGNAGSYQQVRSLASTCIRQQLKSLDAFKFVFYTIDFEGQLSGVSGLLIEEQMKFVHKSIRTIVQLHPADINGVILVGHSVGGFISKVLFSEPKFDRSSVPLLISLASPLIRPYLTFDEKMNQLYDRANRFWAEYESNDTLSISISGGRSDRLVPMHMSIDTNFDISLTTSSMNDVWLDTDHVCITWCRELMHKLAHLLSALMDKKHTRLIGSKHEAISIMKKELLTKQHTLSKETKAVINKDWKSMRPYTVAIVQGYYSAHRSKLGDRITILNLKASQATRFLIIIDHIEALKQKELFGCKDLNVSDNNSLLTCHQRIDLLHLAHSIPTRRFEPRKTALIIEISEHFPVNYLALDFLGYTKNQPDTSVSGLPESIILQELDRSAQQSVTIPPLYEFVWRKMPFISNYAHKIESPKAYPLIYLNSKIENFDLSSVVYDVKLESSACYSGNLPNVATILFYQDGYLHHSSLPVAKDKNSLVASMKISPKNLVQFAKAEREQQTKKSYLELYLDGTCENHLHIELDVIGTVVETIQRDLSKLLAIATFVSFRLVIKSVLTILREPDASTKANRLTKLLAWCIEIFPLYWLLQMITDSKWDHRSSFTASMIIDSILTFIIILILSTGLVAFFEHLLKRVTDLAIIVNNAQTFLRIKLIPQRNQEQEKSTTTNGPNTLDFKLSRNKTWYLNADFDLLLMTIAFAGSFVFSAALMSVFTILLLIKMNLRIEVAKATHSNQSTPESCSINKHCHRESEEKPQNLISEKLQALTLSIAILCALSLLSNIPVALMMMRGNRSIALHGILDPHYTDINFIASSITLVLVKIICSTVEKRADAGLIGNKVWGNERITKANISKIHPSLLCIHRMSYLVCLWPIVMVNSNMCHITTASATTFSWLCSYLYFQDEWLTIEVGKPTKTGAS